MGCHGLRVKAIKTQPSVKLALIVQEVKTISLSHVAKLLYSSISLTC